MRDLVLGLGIGWAAAITPGPLSVLVVSSSIQRGFAAGVRIAVAPLLTDAPIVALGVLVATGLSDSVVNGLSIAGGLYLIWLGIADIRRSDDSPSDGDGGGDLRRGFFVNLLSPHPWLFWTTVGGPLTVEAWGRSPGSGVAFVSAFFVALVGVKVMLAAVAASTGTRLDQTWRRRLSIAGGSALIVFGGFLAVGAI